LERKGSFTHNVCARLNVGGVYSTLSLSESVRETFKMVLSFESVDEILLCDHSNETSSAVLPRDTIYIQLFYKIEFGIFLEFGF